MNARHLDVRHCQSGDTQGDTQFNYSKFVKSIAFLVKLSNIVFLFKLKLDIFPNKNKKQKQEANGQHRSPEKTVHINKHI